MVIMHLKLPCQPVVDLESYMNSLEKKKQSVEKMVGKLAPQKNEAATKSFDLKSQHVQCTLYFYMF